MEIRTSRWLGAAVVVLAVGGAAALADVGPMTAKEQANLKFVLDWWRDVLQARHLDLAPKYQAENYIQHNINVPTGRAGFVQYFGRIGAPITPNPRQAGQPAGGAVREGRLRRARVGTRGQGPCRRDQDLQVQHLRHAADRNDKVQEHWDYAQKAKGGRPAARLTASTTRR